MTTDPRQTAILSADDERQAYEAALQIRLKQLAVWTQLPDERTDWDLELLLDEIRAGALILRKLRDQEQELPF